jgi:hypothetical protein
MHILIYSDDSDRGGVAQFDHALALGLRRAACLVSVVKPMAQSPLRAEKVAAGITCTLGAASAPSACSATRRCCGMISATTIARCAPPKAGALC